MAAISDQVANEAAVDLQHVDGQTPGLRTLAATAVGTKPSRAFPHFAREPFDRAFRRRAGARNGTRVVLWPDTFNNHFYPNTAHAAVAVLESAGGASVLPRTPICCGRPLYDFGYLDEARSRLLKILEVLRDDIDARTPVVELLIRIPDELVKLLPDDEEARRLAALCMDLPTYLEKCPKPPSWRRLGRTAL